MPGNIWCAVDRYPTITEPRKRRSSCAGTHSHLPESLIGCDWPGFIHNHFILKSVALTAPGGYVAVISSHFTMDSANQRARRDMGQVADLVGAVRLPTKAFARVAGTDAVTDILILRKREEDREPGAGQDWIDTRPVPATDKDGGYTEIDVNAYFAAHPENILGALHVGHGMYNADTLEVRSSGDAPLGQAVRERLAVMTRDATERGLALTATPESTTTLDAGTFDQGLLTAAEGRQNTALATLRYTPSTTVCNASTAPGGLPTRRGRARSPKPGSCCTCMTSAAP